METAAAVEIDQGGLRRYFLEDFHRCLEKPRTTLGFSTVTTGSAAINQKPKNNKTGQITCYQNRTFLLATDKPKWNVGISKQVLRIEKTSEGLTPCPLECRIGSSMCEAIQPRFAIS